MDELEIYKNKAVRLEKALRQITDIRWRSYDCMLSTAKYALEEEARIELERGLTPLAPDSSKAGVLSLPESVKVENALPAESG